MSTKPNVLLISTDHWPASLLGVAGHPAVQTPTLLERFGLLYRVRQQNMKMEEIT
jgi:arylsulfatase A-like enzyme